MELMTCFPKFSDQKDSFEPFFPGHGRWNNHGKQRREPLARHQNRSIDGSLST